MKWNTKCCNCNKLIYKKPSHIKKYKVSYCSQQCSGEHRTKVKRRPCEICSKVFKPGKQTGRFCSRACANIGRYGIAYRKDGFNNESQRKLALLKTTFNFDSCMVEGCGYSLTYDIHRYIPGKDGGEYVIGNMFAICPNCHAEVTRGLAILEKINDYTLRKRKPIADGDCPENS